MAVTVTMPHLGESVTEGMILSWAKQPGETIAEDEVLLEISIGGDKVDTEVPSPIAGVIQEILVSAGQSVSVGTPLAVIAEPPEAAGASRSAAPAAAPAAVSPASSPHTPPPAEAPAPRPPEPQPATAAVSPQGGRASAAGGAAGTEPDTLRTDFGTGEDAVSGQTWVTLEEAELRTGVAMSTLRKWRKRHKIASRAAEGPRGMEVRVPLEAVSELAAQKAARAARREERPQAASPTTSAEEGPPQWAMQLLALADARAGQLLDRLAQAERERADAERDAAIERHKRERAEAEAARLRDELATLSDPHRPEGVRPEPVVRSETQTPYAAFTARMRRWNDLRRRRF